MEDISKLRILPIDQNFDVIQAENTNLKKGNKFLMGLIIIGIIAMIIYFSDNKQVEENEK